MGELERVDLLDDLIFYGSSGFKHYKAFRKNHRHCTEISREEENMKKWKKKSVLGKSIEQYKIDLENKAKTKTVVKEEEESILDSDLCSFVNNKIESQQVDIDPDYVKFFSAVKVDGLSYSIEVTDCSGVPKLHRYEADNKFQRKAKNAEKLGKAEMSKKKSSTMKTVPEISMKGKVRGKGKAIEDDFKVKEEAEDDYVPCELSGEYDYVPCELSGEDVDEHYYAYFQHTPASKDDEKMVLKDSETSEVEIVEPENTAVYGNGYSPFVPSKCCLLLSAEERWESGKDSDKSQYRKELMDLLKEPYDQIEFDDLWRVMTQKKPVQGCVNLRGAFKLYPTITGGKSYLQLHEDVRTKIDAFRPDRRKILYLLRGFFFWLKKTAHQDSFKPWLDSQFLEALTKGDFLS